MELDLQVEATIWSRNQALHFNVDVSQKRFLTAGYKRWLYRTRFTSGHIDKSALDMSRDLVQFQADIVHKRSSRPALFRSTRSSLSQLESLFQSVPLSHSEMFAIAMSAL